MCTRLFKIIILYYYINKIILLYYLRLLYCRIINLQLYKKYFLSDTIYKYNIQRIHYIISGWFRATRGIGRGWACAR